MNIKQDITKIKKIVYAKYGVLSDDIFEECLLRYTKMLNKQQTPTIGSIIKYSACDVFKSIQKRIQLQQKIADDIPRYLRLNYSLSINIFEKCLLHDCVSRLSQDEQVFVQQFMSGVKLCQMAESREVNKGHFSKKLQTVLEKLEEMK